MIESSHFEKKNTHQETARYCAAAYAGVNIALIKYWGKRDYANNLPAVGSLSLTLSSWGSETQVRWVTPQDLGSAQAPAQAPAGHQFTLNGRQLNDRKVIRLLDLIRERVGFDRYAQVISTNTVPTASGLASSASGMAALGLCAWYAAGLLTHLPSRELNPDLIELVRVGSGSAPRSLLGGLVSLDINGRELRQLCSPKDWPLALVVAVVDRGPKAVSSREGMEHTRQTSPYYQAWIDSHPLDLECAKEAIKARDLDALGEVMEHSTMKMHASMWAARPPLRYLKGVSLELLDCVKSLRQDGVSAWATMDAGPHVKVLCSPEDAELIKRTLSNVPNVEEILILSSGEGAQLRDIF